MDSPKLQNFNSKRGQQLPPSLYQHGRHGVLSTEAPPRKTLRGGISKVNFTRFFSKRGHFLPKVDKSGQTAPITGTGYPHEGPFVELGLGPRGGGGHHQGRGHVPQLERWW